MFQHIKQWPKKRKIFIIAILVFRQKSSPTAAHTAAGTICKQEPQAVP